MERPTCQTCAYWRRRHDHLKPDGTMLVDGDCQRHSPVITKRGDSRHPSSLSSHSCGDHPDFPAYIASTRQPAGPEPEPDRFYAHKTLAGTVAVFDGRSELAVLHFPPSAAAYSDAVVSALNRVSREKD